MGQSGPPPSTWFPGPTQVNNQNGISISSWHSHFFTVHSSIGRPSPPSILPLPWGILTHLIHDFLGPPDPTTQTASRTLDWISRFCTAHGTASLYFTMGRPSPLQNCPFPRGDQDPHLTRFLKPIQAHNPNDILTGWAVFAQLTTQCPYTLQWATPSPQNCPFPWADLDPSNTIPAAHQSSQPKRHLAQLSCFCTAHHRVTLYFTLGCPLPIVFHLERGANDLHMVQQMPLPPNHLLLH